MDSAITVYITIGNSDNRLTQQRWSAFIADLLTVVQEYSTQIYGPWYSSPTTPLQNACVGVVVSVHHVDRMRARLTELRHEYSQDSIAWAPVDQVRFL